MIEKQLELSKALQEAKKNDEPSKVRSIFIKLRLQENKMEKENINFSRFTEKGRLRSGEAMRLTDFGMSELGFKAEPKAESKEPKVEPKAESKEPKADSKEPKAESKEPKADSKEPKAESKEPPNVFTPPDASSRAFGRKGGEKEKLQDFAETLDPDDIDIGAPIVEDEAEVEKQEDILTREEAGFQQVLEGVEKFYDDREKTLLSAAEKDANEDLRMEAVRRAYIDAGRTFDESAYAIERARVMAREAYNRAAEDPTIPHNNLRGDDKINTGIGVGDHSTTKEEIATDPLGQQSEVVAEAQAKAEEVKVEPSAHGSLRGNAEASSSREAPTPAPTQPTEAPEQPTTEAPEQPSVRLQAERVTASTVPTIDIETGVGGPSIPQGVFNRNEGLAIADEDKKRSKKTIDQLKDEIRAYHIVYDDNIPEFASKPHQGQKNDALKSKDIRVVRRHHKDMETTIRNYFKTTSLKIGVIYDINSIRQPIGVQPPAPGTIPGMTRQEIISQAATGETNKQSLRRAMKFTDPYGRAIAGDVNPPRGGLHSHQQAPIKNLIPKSGKILSKPSKIYNPIRGVDAPYQYVLKRPSREMAISVKIKGLNSGGLI